MDMSGLAAVLALLGIPISVILARWQMRTALRQTEAAHRTALDVAEAARQSAVAAAKANHRSALELADVNQRRALEAAEANHRRALELARNQAEADRIRWLTEARRAEYRLFQNSLAQFRRALLARDLVVSEVEDAFNELHHAKLAIHSVGPEEVQFIASHVTATCWLMTFRRLRRAASPTLEDREAWWSQVRPHLAELNDVVKGASNSNFWSVSS